MEATFIKLLLYLVGGIVYVVFFQEKTRKEASKTPLPPSTEASNWEEEFVMPRSPVDDWGKAAVITTSAEEETIEEAPTQLDAPLAAAVQPPSSNIRSRPKIERVLGRYSGWKKALVMSEIMRPYL